MNAVARPRWPRFPNAHLSDARRERRALTRPREAVGARPPDSPRAISAVPAKPHATHPAGRRSRPVSEVGASARTPTPARSRRIPLSAPWRPPVLAEQRHLPLHQHDQLVRPPRRGDADLVRDDAVRGDCWAVAGSPGAQRQIGVLAVHVEARVEAAEPLPHGARREQEAAGDDPDLADGVTLPAAERLRVENARVLEHRAEHRREAEEAPERGLTPARAGVDATVGFQRPASGQACFGMVAGECDEVHPGVGGTTASGSSRNTCSPSAFSAFAGIQRPRRSRGSGLVRSGARRGTRRGSCPRCRRRTRCRRRPPRTRRRSSSRRSSSQSRAASRHW